MTSVIDKCPFCRKFHKGGQGRHAVFDQILWEDDDFVVVPAAGCFTTGYVLLIPRRHYTSIAELPPDLLLHTIELRERIRHILTKTFRPPIFFEHGIVNRSNRGGACVEHAHLHCVATDIDLTEYLSEKHKISWCRLRAYRDIARQILLKESYVYYEDQGSQMFLFSDENLPSQYMRRLLAGKLGFSGPEWDYAVFTFEENAERTSAMLKGARW